MNDKRSGMKRFPVVPRGKSFDAIDVVANRSYAEWVVTAKQTSDLVLDDDVLTEIIETPITLRGVTTRFVGDRIAELRHYWDEVPLREGLGLIPAD